MAAGFEIMTTEDLLGDYKTPLDVFSYHYYNKELVLGENDTLPELLPVKAEGVIEVAPGGCTFFVL